MFGNEILTVVIIASVVGGATCVGSLCAFFVKRISGKMSDIILSFAAGVMLSVAFFGLILPAMESTSNFSLPCLGILAGAAIISILERFVPHIHNYVDVKDTNKEILNTVFLFIIAIMIHNIPEGMAVGISFGTEHIGDALTIAIGISIHNFIQGMITTLMLIMAGLQKKIAFFVALAVGFTEIVGVFLGYGAANVADAILPFILAAAGGTLLYVICNEMIPETHSHGYAKTATYSLIVGLIVMMLLHEITL